MGSEPSPPPLPPPPLQPEPESEPDWRLSWWTAAYLAATGALISVGVQVAYWALLSAGGLLASTAGWPMVAAQGAAHGTLEGSGVVLLDRFGPAAWPRALRWGLGALAGSVLGHAITLPSYLHPLLSGGPGAPPASVLISIAVSYGVSAVGTAAMGYCLGAAVARDASPWRRLPLVGLVVSAVIGTVFCVWSLLGMRLGAPGYASTFAQWWPTTAIGLGSALASGLLSGCAYAAGLKR